MKKILFALSLLFLAVINLHCGGGSTETTTDENTVNRPIQEQRPVADSDTGNAPATSEQAEENTDMNTDVTDDSVPAEDETADDVNNDDNNNNNNNEDPEQPPVDNPLENPVNHQPILPDLNEIDIEEGELLSLDIVAVDEDGDSLVYSSNNLPSGATLDSNTGILEWYPDLDQSGDYEINVTVTDGELSDSAVMTITVADTWDRIQIADNNARYDPDVDALGNVAFWWDGGMYLFNTINELVQVSLNSHCGVSCNIDFRNAGRPSIWNGQIVWGARSDNPNLATIYYYDGARTHQLTTGDSFAGGPMIANGTIAWEAGEPRQIYISDNTGTRAVTSEPAGSSYGNYQPYVSTNGKVVWNRRQGYQNIIDRVGYFDGSNTFNPLACPACFGVKAHYDAFIHRSSNMPWTIGDGPIASYVYSINEADYEKELQDREHHSQNDNLVWRRANTANLPQGNWDVMFYDGQKVYKVYSNGFAAYPRTGGNRIAWRDQITLSLYVAYKK